MKILFIIFGIISFILGAIGVVLPILPTTPFLLLSAFLFSKSSDRFHEYLIQTKLYQKYINEMVIERKTTRKKRNQSLFTVTLIFLIAVMITPVWIGKICLLMVMSIHHFIMLMNKIDQKRENEKRILKVMIDIYQRKHPQESKMCENLYKYACLRIDKCPFMETKTFCSGCKVHCYQKEYRSQVKKVMRFSGKYMLFYHPLLTIKHGWLSLKERRRKNV